MNKPYFFVSQREFFYIFLCVSLSTHTVVADDIEIFIHPSVEPIPPNVLFLLDESDSMKLGPFDNPIPLPDSDPNQRLHQLKEAMKNIFMDPQNSNINAAIAAYTTRDHNEPSTRVLQEFSILGPNRSEFLNAVDQLTYNSLTPIVNALAAANLWFEQGYLGHSSPIGENPKGNWCKPNVVVLLTDGDPSSFGTIDWLNGTLDTSTVVIDYDLSNLLSWPIIPWELEDGTTVYAHQQPINHGFEYRGIECKPDIHTDYIYNPFDEYSFYYFEPLNTLFSNYNPSSLQLAGYGYCTQEIVSWGTSTDLKEGGEWDWKEGDISHDVNIKRIQSIQYYTIGLAMGSSATPTDQERYLQFIARLGGGKYFRANNAESLTQAFQEILDDAKKSIDYAYTAPTIPFSPDNAAISGTDIFVPVFEPNLHPLWYGNLKKYTISFVATDPDDPNSPKKVIIQGANSVAALSNGFFSESAADLWNNSNASPGLPLNGGAASNMTPQNEGSRNLFTVLDETSGTPLRTDAYRISASNGNLTSSLLNTSNFFVPDTTPSQFRDMVLNWISLAQDITLPDGSGGQVVVSHRYKMGAPIHSKPIVVRTQTRDIVFVNTTEGILHALDADSGEELWAYMPKDLLPTLTTSFISDWNASKPHDPETGTALDGHPHTLLPEYGLDGPLVTYESNDHRYLVMGMRRGGRNYYALDITDPMNPVFAWKIEGGTSDFPKLGQTWSKPIFATVQFHGSPTETEVLIIGGGYDPKEDQYFIDANQNGVYDPGEQPNARSDDTMGNVIYFVNPVTGERINNGNFHGVIDSVVKGHMGNAIAADILPVDINANGIVDRLYAVDVGGRVIRVDIPDHAIAALTGNGKISATILADVNVTRNGDTYTDQAGNDYQRFFNAPEAAYFSKGGTQYLALLIGSGHLSKPLSDLVAHDRFYMIKDPNVWTAPADGNDPGNDPDYPDVIAENDLYDTTANTVQIGNSDQQAQAASEIAAAQGWYFNLNNGEKVFSPAKVYDYAVLFTSYEGVSPFTDDPCEAVYSNGTSRFYAVDMTNGSAVFAEMNRSKVINTPGLPSTPYIITPAATGSGNGSDKDEPKLSGDIIGMVGLQEVIRWSDRFHPISWEEATGEDSSDEPPACN